MKILKLAPIAFGVVLTATAAVLAQDLDADGDGMVSMDEFAAAYPDLGEDAFTAADANADGMLDADEIAAATEAGVIPAM